MKVCPLCAEFAPAETQFCKWCRIRLVDRAVPYPYRSGKPRSDSPARLLCLILVGLIAFNVLASWFAGNPSLREALFGSPPASMAARPGPSSPKGAHRNRSHSGIQRR